ncbi:hypothetical protein FNW02_32325 [Komarekiella sp. 'clone 1']|uniref:Uncharacterized protein n=1 Tax=Komarekiella delphini-convector SJRDD-AB1 TaxID=2593771 RepID=A0AA40T460_9NOST|nr:hypothetical protein [Komarekiella delphini-convector]MBD6620345.1 hypothetical protein [Komarekiella delphini-convector SJRDD-AB1]
MPKPKFVLDLVEKIVEIAIFIGLIILAIYKFDVDVIEAGFYLVLAAISSPLSKVSQTAKRTLLICGFMGGNLIGYFN